MHASAQNQREDDQAVNWFVRIDGHLYGPIARDRMERFLEPPRLCPVMEVKCGEHGVWFTISAGETIEHVLTRAGIPLPEPIAQPMEWPEAVPSRMSVARAWIGAHFGGMGYWLARHWLAATGVVGYLAFNAIFLVAMRDPTVREREILSTYEAIWNEARQFESADPSEEDWRQFADGALAELQPILRELERSASARQPVRQNLLFAGRENLVTILKENHPPASGDSQVVLFDRRLSAARRDLPEEQGRK